jgi:hypothetical protein
MIAVMAGKGALGMIGVKLVIDVIGKVMGTLADILFIRSIIIKEDVDF